MVNLSLLFVGMFILSVRKYAYFLLFTILNRTKLELKKNVDMFVKSVLHFSKQISALMSTHTQRKEKKRKEFSLELLAPFFCDLIVFSRVHI